MGNTRTRSSLPVALACAACLFWAGEIAAHAADARRAAMELLLCAVLCAAVLACARWVRGRFSRWDALQPLLLVLLPALSAPTRAGCALLLAASVLLALASCGRERLRQTFLGPEAPGRRVLRQETLGYVALALLVWLARLELPEYVPDDTLDSSWGAALGSFLAHGKQAGSDWVFTAGPLGGLSVAVFRPELFWLKLLLWEAVWRLCTVVCLVLAASRIEGLFERTLCFLVLVAAEMYFDSYALATIVAAGVLLGDPQRERRTLLDFVALLALCGMALAKFTLFSAVIGLVGCLSISRGLHLGARAGLGLALGALALLCASWFLCGQGLANIWPYLWSSWQIASHYSEAESLAPLDPHWRLLGLGCVALLGASLLLWTCAGGSARVRGAQALGLLLVLFCAWKTGFVRASDHASFFFGFALPAALLLPRPRVEGILRNAGVVGLRLCAFGLSLGGMLETQAGQHGIFGVIERLKQAPLHVRRSLQVLADPSELQRQLERQLDVQRETQALAKVGARVGRESIDMLGHRQGLLLLADLNWTPRPVFQGYLTFTRELQQRNADFLSGPQAPRYLLGHLESIDDRWPMMDDALALEVVDRCYAPLLMERDYLLLERRAQALPEPARELLLERRLKFEEPLQLPRTPARGALLLSLDLDYTLPGELWQLLDSTPELSLSLQREDGVELSFRIVPAMMRSRVQIDPPLCITSDWVRWMLGRELPHAVALTIHAPRHRRFMLHDTFGLRLERAAQLQPPLVQDFELHEWTEGIFHPDPDEVMVPLAPLRKQLAGRECVVVHAPSRLAWNLQPGRYRVSGSYGMLPETWKQEQVDGADFFVSLWDGQQTRVLVRRAFRPGMSAGELALQRLDEEFVLERKGTLVLATSVGPDKDPTCDWCLWSDVRIETQSGAAPPR